MPDALGDNLRLQRRWMQGKRFARQDRPKGASGEAVAVKRRQRVEDDVIWLQGHVLIDLVHIGKHI